MANRADFPAPVVKDPTIDVNEPSSESLAKAGVSINDLRKLTDPFGLAVKQRK